MSDPNDENWNELSEQLRCLFSREQLARFCDQYGGVRLYVPTVIPADHKITDILGNTAANKLEKALGGCTIRVPLMRGLRASLHKENGKSHAWIARHLGITESGVDKLFSRQRKKAKRPKVFSD